MPCISALRLLLAGLALALWPSAAPAASCQLNSYPVAFGAYDALSTRTHDTSGSVNVTCDTPVPYSISLGPGGGSHSQRRMAGAGADLLYNLYTTRDRLVVWGDGTGGTDSVSGSGTQNHTVHARMPARQPVPAGSYSDLIVVTVTY